jgi:hypothetical protein
MSRHVVGEDDVIVLHVQIALEVVRGFLLTKA